MWFPQWFRSQTARRVRRAWKNRCFGRCLRFEPLECRALLSSAPMLVQDINIGTQSSSPQGALVELNGEAFFSAGDDTHGMELWKTDGTAAGTTLVKDLVPGPQGTDIASPVVFGGRLYFTAAGGLWKSDGTEAGTTIVTAGWYTGLVDLNGTLYFAGESIDGSVLYRYDASARRPTVVKEIRDPWSHAYNGISQLTVVDDTLFFVAHDPAVIDECEYSGFALWKSDGTEAGTTMLRAFAGHGGPEFPWALTAFNGEVYFAADDDPDDGVFGRLWKSDGTVEGTVLVKDVREPRNFTVFGGHLYFGAGDATYGSELWRTDGTAAGTVVVADINPHGSSSPQELTVANGAFYFTAEDGTSGRELWKSDGTAAGTVRVKDIAPGASTSDPAALTSVGGTLFLSADDGVRGRELWKSTGTELGTVMVADLNPGGSGLRSGWQSLLGEFDGKLLFTAGDGALGFELWQSDGTEGGTALVKDINVSGVGSLSGGVVDPFVESGGTVFFAADDGIHGRELWASDGTPEGTVMVADIRNGQGGSNPQDLFAVNGTVYFTASDGIHPWGLWRTDGTAAGTQFVTGWLEPGADSPWIVDMVDFNGTLVFMTGQWLDPRRWGYMKRYDTWTIDATSGEPIDYGFLRVGWSAPEPGDFTNFAGALFFRFGSAGELWKTDGTFSGTAQVKDIWPGPNGSVPRELTVVNGSLYFTANDGVHGRELWKSDGTTAGTVMVKDIRPDAVNYAYPHELTNVGGTLFFAADDGQHGTELWSSDGTTLQTTMVADLTAGAAASLIEDLTDVDGTLFFEGPDGLWKSNGTAPGTMRVKAFSPGYLSWLTEVNGRLFFVGDNGTEPNYQLWTSDGNATVRIADRLPDVDYSRAANLIDVNGTLFFSAYEVSHGYELWKLETDGLFRTAAIDVALDRGTINVASSGVITVSILTTPTFDAALVDAATVDFAGATAVQSVLTDIDGDGDLDLLLHFRIQDTMLAAIYRQLVAEDLDGDGKLDSRAKTASVSLAGLTIDKELFQGSDTVNLSLSGRALRSLLDELFAQGIL